MRRQRMKPSLSDQGAFENPSQRCREIVTNVFLSAAIRLKVRGVIRLRIEKRGQRGFSFARRVVWKFGRHSATNRRGPADNPGFDRHT